ncbi:MAG: hypothetical protein O3B70_04005 [Bacteroidetes bacterium]|nr:hypothetical protein [Bacteroidota bacterium]MDA0903478.1 hypothetical protein [Bacteroidota bacterium]MDA1241937.1 hypothetical protein [Bacteroidota bacterium]
MKRSQFLQAVGAALALPAAIPLSAASQSLQSRGREGGIGRSNCVLVPTETAGPFPLDLTENEYFFRQEIQEDRVGVRLRQRVRIVGAANCEPMPNVRVNVWHCDRDGDYSGYAAMGSEGLTYCRGYQITDANGECEFLTIVPGWYPGRVTHMHFQVHVSSQYSVVSQWTWPHETLVEVLNEHPDLYPAGPDPMSPEQDGVFVDGFELQLADLMWDEASGEYVSFFEATVEGEGTSGVGHLEWQAAQVFDVGQNHPNPVVSQTTIPVHLVQSAALSWSLWSPDGKRVYSEHLGTLSQGAHEIVVDFGKLGLPPASYIYQVEAVTTRGRFPMVRRMTVL